MKCLFFFMVKKNTLFNNRYILCFDKKLKYILAMVCHEYFYIILKRWCEPIKLFSSSCGFRCFSKRTSDTYRIGHLLSNVTVPVLKLVRPILCLPLDEFKRYLNSPSERPRRVSLGIIIGVLKQPLENE